MLPSNKPELYPFKTATNIDQGVIALYLALTYVFGSHLGITVQLVLQSFIIACQFYLSKKIIAPSN